MWCLQLLRLNKEGEIMSEDNVQAVKVTSIDIPFRDIFWLTFKAVFASLLAGMFLGAIAGLVFIIGAFLGFAFFAA